jgi:SNF2 family DNA or RNA helicase
MQVEDNVILKTVLPTPLATKVLSNLSQSELLHDLGNVQKVAVYWGYQEAEMLAKYMDEHRPLVDLPEVPSPILRDYDWPGIYKPFNHQKTTASFLSIRPRAFCFNEAGTGKTSAAIWAADYLMKLGLVKRVLVICPLSIMYSAWQADIFKTAMHRTCAVAHGSGNKRRKVLDQNYDFVIINYEGINIVQDALVAKEYDLIIVDEANAYKSVSTRRWRSLAKIVSSKTRLWLMTGTPASQSPEDAFGLARLISPARVPRFVTAWRDHVMYQVTKFRWMPRADAKTKVFKALQPAIRFTKAECLDLPEVIYQTRIVPMTLQAQTYYKRLKAQMMIEAAGEHISAVNAATSLNKLLQISGGAVYADGGAIVEFDISPRLNALGEVLDETSNKLIVFVPYRHTITVVKEYLESQRVKTEVIDGNVSAKERAEIINRFQTQTDPRVLVIQPQSASHGITLTAADTIVFWSPVMSVETYLQCIGRIDRYGQKNKMTVVHLQGSEVERRVYEMLHGKVDSHNKLVDLYKQEMEVSDAVAESE